MEESDELMKKVCEIGDYYELIDSLISPLSITAHVAD